MRLEIRLSPWNGDPQEWRVTFVYEADTPLEDVTFVVYMGQHDLPLDLGSVLCQQQKVDNFGPIDEFSLGPFLIFPDEVYTQVPLRALVVSGDCVLLSLVVEVADLPNLSGMVAKLG